MRKILAWFILSIILLIVALFIALQFPKVQTRLAQFVAGEISQTIQSKVSIDKIKIKFNGAISIDGFYVEDLHQDTLLYAQHLDASLAGFYLNFQRIIFDKVDLNNAQFNLRQYPGEEDLNIQFILDALKSGDTSAVSGPSTKLFFWKVNLDNVRFRFNTQDSLIDSAPEIIDYENMDIYHIKGELSQFSIIDDSLFGNIKNMSCRERSGLRLDDFDADFTVAPSLMSFNGLNVAMENSKVQGNIIMDYESFDELSNFVEDVFIRAMFSASKVNLNDLRFFAPELKGLDQMIDLTGNLIGTIENLRGRSIRLYYGNDTKFAGNFEISGLPDINDTYFNFRFDELKTSRADLQNIQAYPFNSGKLLEIPDIVERMGTIVYRGKFLGFIDDFVTEGNIISQLGRAQTDIRLSFNPDIDDYEYSGKLNTVNFDLGRLLDEKPLLGNLSCNLDLSGSYFNLDLLDVELNGTINNIDLNGYNYKNLNVVGMLEKRKFNGDLKINDPNLKLNFYGEVNLRMTIPEFNFNADLVYADFTALGLLSLDSSLTASAKISSNFTGSNIDDLEGSIYIDYTDINIGTKHYSVSKLVLEASGSQINKQLSFKSDIFNANINGRFKLLELDQSAKKILNSFLPSFTILELRKTTSTPFNQNFTYEIEIKDLELLSDLFFPFLKISSGTTLVGDFSTIQNKISTKINAKSLKVMDYQFNNFFLNASSGHNSLDIAAGARTFNITDSLQLHRLNLDANAMRDSMGYTFNWANSLGSEQEGELNGNLYFSGKDINVHLLPSFILIKEQIWVVSDDNKVSINDTSITFSDLSFVNEHQFIRIDGIISHNETDELDIILDNFELENINAFIPTNDVFLKGNSKGIISLSNLYDKPFFKSNLNIAKFNVNDIMLGDGEINSKWDSRVQKFIVDASLRRDTLRTFRLVGEYDPNDDKNGLNLNVSLRNIQMRLFQPFVDILFSEVDGFLSGNLALRGTLNKPELSGELKVNKGKIVVDFLNTMYTFSHSIQITKDKIEIKNMTVYDGTRQANTGIVNFSIKHEYFNNMYLDLLVNANKLQALNTVENQNELFYGTAYASGTFRAYGSFDNIKMDINAKTERGTVFNLPLFGADEVNQDNFINFVDRKNPVPVDIKKRRKVEPKGFELNFVLEVTPDAEALLIFDPTVGDLIRGRGRGNLRMVVTEVGEFLLFGEYVINQGEYLFTLQNVINKKFEVESGGTIIWKGNPLDADINLTAIYPTRTSLYELVKEIDTSAVYKRKTDVHAVLYMNDKLLNPTISFDIRFPNSDENTKNLAMSQIPNEDEMSKQVMGILLLNQFFPVSGGIGGGGGGVGSNASELLSNQLSNWLSKVSDNVDIGVNYRTGNPQSADEITVQLSTQISDRVSFDSNVGQVSNVNNPQTTNLVGEFNIEIKITEDGKVRLKIFNRSNQYILITNDVPYTQGVGLFYRRDFDTFSDLRRSKNKKTEKEENKIKSKVE